MSTTTSLAATTGTLQAQHVSEVKTTAERFQGSYKLHKYTTQLGDGTEHSAFGKEWSGRIIYYGAHMTALLSAKTLAKWEPSTGDDPEKGWPVGNSKQCQAVARDTLAYSGPFVIDDDASTVTHQVDVATLPEGGAIYAGFDQIRHFEFPASPKKEADSVLKLQASVSTPSGMLVHRLVWYREE